ncbi:MAG: hypothetical protein QOD53_881 [Thermoleophilaceae bacterium]|nr:hypothetical protein [Thermoleophilaceae bacterium]
MGVLDKAKAAAEQAAAKAKEGVEDVQTKRSLAPAYEQLGRTAFELLESGEIDHPRLQEKAAEIREIESRIEHPVDAEPVGAATSGSDGAPPPPPAMPA